MGRIVLGVIVGFIVWSIIWVGGEEVLAMLSPDWYGVYKVAFERAAFNKTPFEANSTILLLYLVRSVMASLLSGYLAALVSNENGRTTLILGVLLLVVGVIVQAMLLDLLPIWYHVIFLILLIPVTIAGGKLKKV